MLGKYGQIKLWCKWPLQSSSSILCRWHLGWCKEDYFPHKRGFDSFMGIMHSGASFYNYTTGAPVGYDLWSNFNINRTYDGVYATVSASIMQVKH